MNNKLNNKLNEYLNRLDEHLGESKESGAHPQYIEGPRDAIDILRDVLE